MSRKPDYVKEAFVSKIARALETKNFKTLDVEMVTASSDLNKGPLTYKVRVGDQPADFIVVTVRRVQ